MKKLQTVTISLAIVALLVISFFVPPAAKADPVKLTYSCHHGPTDVHAKLIEAWIKEVETRTNGKVKIQFFPGQSLVPAPQTYDGVLSGITDIGFSILQYTRGRFPLMDFINLPLGYPSGPVNTAIINEVLEKFHPAELNDVKVLYLHAHGPGFLHTKNKPINVMDDLKGLKIRSNGPTADMVVGLSGTPTALPMPELYEALQKGVVDGGVWDFSASVDWKLAEVSNYSIISPPIAYSLGFFVVINKDKWNSLDPEVKKVMEELSPEWAKKHGLAWQDSENRGKEFIKKLGKNIITINPEESAKWRKAVQPVVDTYIKMMESKGLPGKEVIEYVEKRINDANAGNFKSKYL